MKINEAIKKARDYGFRLEKKRYDVYSKNGWVKGFETLFVEDFDTIESKVFDFVKNYGCEVLKVTTSMLYTKDEKSKEFTSSTYWLLGMRVIPDVKF